MPEIELLVRFRYLILSVLFSANLSAQTHPIKAVDSLLTSGINKIILQNYSGAKNTFVKLDYLYPDNPLGEIYLAGTEIAMSVDYEKDFNNFYIDSLLSLAEEKTEKLLDRDENNIWFNYYNALIFGYKAYYKALQNNIISALSNGIESLQSFKKCLETNPNFYEAYIAAGTYNYWKSAQAKSFLWLPFISDKREKGIKLLEKAVEHLTYNYYLAAYSLIWIYIDYEQSEKAIALSLKMLNKYPHSRFFKWALARAYEDTDLTKAITIYKELLNSIETLKVRNGYNDIVLRHKIAMLYYKKNEKNKALKLCNEILDFKINSVKIKKRLENRIERVRKLQKELLKNK